MVQLRGQVGYPGFSIPPQLSIIEHQPTVFPEYTSAGSNPLRRAPAKACVVWVWRLSLGSLADKGARIEDERKTKRNRDENPFDPKGRYLGPDPSGLLHSLGRAGHVSAKLSSSPTASPTKRRWRLWPFRPFISLI
jgi:hypothetical protein